MNTMRHYRRFLLLLAMLSAATSEMAQTDSLKDCNAFANRNCDIVYLLPSKEICETGEDLWFKAYLMDKQTLALSDKSQTLYLQVRNEKGEVIWSEKYPLMAGRGDGHIYIGENWQQGEYYMEGYTRSSFTADSTTNTHPRRIRVVERVTQMDSISAETVKSDSIQRLTAKHRFDLFPEGGHLVDGINCVMAFKATYGKGFPDDVTGKILEDGKEIASFISVHDGMGKFALTPRQGKDYKVVLTDGRTYSLPAIERTGMALRVLRNNNTSVTMLVSSSDSLPHPFTVFAKQRGVPCCSARGIVKGQQIVRLPIDRFPLQGITEITLSDENDYPVAERLVYVNPTQQLNITVSTDRQQYNRRDEGKVCLKVTDSSGLPLKAELAVSIFDKAYLYLPGHENILSHCHLSEEIRGNIFNPTYYFDERNEDRLQALDLLLMTQGWRSYVWNEKPIKGRQVLTDGLYGKETTSNKLTNKMQLISAFSLRSDSCFILTDSIGCFEITPDQNNASVTINAKKADYYTSYGASTAETVNSTASNIPLSSASSESSVLTAEIGSNRLTKITGLTGGARYAMNLQLECTPVALSANVIDVSVNCGTVPAMKQQMDMSGPTGTATVLNYFCEFKNGDSNTELTVKIAAEEAITVKTTRFTVFELL